MILFDFSVSLSKRLNGNYGDVHAIVFGGVESGFSFFVISQMLMS